MVSDQDLQNAPAGNLPLVQMPLLYFNSFEAKASLSDLALILMVDGQPQARLALSFTTAKTLAKELHKVIDWFETATNNKLLVMSDVQIAYEKAQSNE